MRKPENKFHRERKNPESMAPICGAGVSATIIIPYNVNCIKDIITMYKNQKNLFAFHANPIMEYRIRTYTTV